MTTYTKAPTRTLKAGDLCVFITKRGKLEMTVESDGHFMNAPGSNREVFDRLGVKDPAAFCSKAYGYPSEGGDWPQCRRRDFAALTRAVRAAFAKCRKPTKAEAAALKRAEAEEAKRAAEAAKKAAEDKAKADAARAASRAALPKPAQDFLAYLDANTGAFGCQRQHVIATVGAILGVSLDGK